MKGAKHHLTGHFVYIAQRREVYHPIQENMHIRLYYYHITELHYMRRLERIWICAIQLPY